MPPVTIRDAIRIALQLHQAGRLEDAAKVYRQVLEQEPNNPDALHLMGVLAHQQGRQEAAFEYVRQAIRVSPFASEYYNNLGEICRAMGKRDDAVACFEKAIELSPDYVVAQVNLGNALQQSGRLHEAIAAYRKALDINPNIAAAHNNLGYTLAEMGRLDEALASYRTAVELKPDYIDALLNLGNALQANGQVEEAIASFQRVIDMRPDNAGAHWNKSLALLLKGEFREGWAEHEWRWRRTNFTSPCRNFSQPQWKGEEVRGRTVLLHAEQGFGDTIQFVRYAPLAAERGARVIVECQPEMVALAQGMEGVAQAVPAGQMLPPFDLHTPLLSLPLAFGTTLETIPDKVPYMNPPPALAQAWREKAPPEKGRRKVGLAWAGSPTRQDDRYRSLPLSAFAPLAAAKAVTFYSLQKGKPAEHAGEAPPGITMVDLTDDLRDFADTAALIANLDLVITVDTAVAHLAGAMAKPVWVLLEFAPAWRWLLGRSDSPWYPTMRLFRQSKRGDWEGVLAQVAAESGRWARASQK